MLKSLWRLYRVLREKPVDERTVQQALAGLQSAGVLAAPPTDACVHRYMGIPEFCGRPRFRDSEYCYWHHRSPDKYEDDVVSREFGEGSTLRSAIEREIAAGRSLAGAYLQRAPLGGNWFERGADLSKAILVGANLREVRLSYGSLRDARLEFANLEEAYLSDVNLTGCSLAGARLFRAKLRNSDLSSVRGLEMDNFRNLGRGLRARWEILEEYPDQAAPMYRRLMTYFTQQGDLDAASWAAYRYRLMRHRILRKRLSFTGVLIESAVRNSVGGADVEPSQVFKVTFSIWLTNLVEYLKSQAYWFMFGYGEKPMRVALLAGIVMMAYAALYAALGAIDANSFRDALYFSVVTFTTLGYGDLTPKEPFRIVAASEALTGLVLSGLFLFTLSRRAVGRG